MVLDAVLEIDIINSKVSGTPKCDNMKRFWNVWINNDMHIRDQHNVSFGYMKKRIDFQQKRLPAYVLCLETVKDELAESGESAVFFGKRYEPGSLEKEAIISLVTMLKHIKKKIPNVFRAAQVR